MKKFKSFSSLFIGALLTSCAALGLTSSPASNPDECEILTAVNFYQPNTSDSIFLTETELRNAPPAAIYAPGTTAQPVDKGERIIWARSVRFDVAPDYVFGTWIGDPPPEDDFKNKFVLINFWASWCPPSRCSLPLMNHFAEKYGNDLVVINVSHEDPDVIADFLVDYPDYKAYFSCDPDSTMRNNLEVWGVPHSILIEPDDHIVIWEGFPMLRNAPLKDATLEAFFKLRREQER